MRPLSLLLASLALAACATDPSPTDPERPRMTRELLEDALRAIDPEAAGRPGAIEFTYNGIGMACISDIEHGRMRLVAPVRAASDLTPIQIGAILQANYHSALDARYGLSQGVLYAAFIHPLGPLTPEEIVSAVRQVSNLVLTFGSTYSSGELQYQEQGQAL
jgi:hypothetical protein